MWPVNSKFLLYCTPLALIWIISKILSTHQLKSNYRKLKGKVVLITGASSGIGEKLAHIFYKHGAIIILTGRRPNELFRVLNDLHSMHGDAGVTETFVLDVCSADSVHKVVTTVLQRFGRVDILVNNAGISNRCSVAESEHFVFEKVMDVNYFGVVNMTTALLQSMIALQSGHIVNVSSLQGKIALPFRSAYGAAKHAVEAFSDSLRAEVADKGINVTVICPSYVQTDLSKHALSGTGAFYGVTDRSTANGYPPEFVAEEIVRAVVLGVPELYICPAWQWFAVLLRYLYPRLFFYIMKLRVRLGKS